MPEPFVPETITVHLGRPDEPAENVTIPFPDYIKNVASSEIYPTWPESAIRANIYAQVSFALNRIYTEWYRSRGYPFDITNSTAYDQAFVFGRDIFDNIGSIVDELFNEYVVRGASVEPLFTQYCNGTTVTCEGLSQWGTVPLAEQGYSPYEILTHFYGDELSIRTAPVRAPFESYPGIPLRLGTSSNEVRTLQLRLNRISANYPAIPKVTVNGIFDQDTENAVRAFQRIFQLTEDGIVGKETWYRIQYVFASVKRLAELNSEGLSLEDVSLQYTEQLSEGMTGTPVRILQYMLAVVGAYYPEVPYLSNIDGVFGPQTRDAVIAFQRLRGLTPDGIVGRETWNALYNTYITIYQNQQEYFGGGIPLYPGTNLLLGSRGDAVTQLQRMINELATVYPEIPTLPETGFYGEMTRDAVIAAQNLFGLEPTGITNYLTWITIAQQAETIMTGRQTAPTQYPGTPVGPEGGGTNA
ncbi:MAG: peptidoglycan-binding protein [Butyricicoccaceae bacterium]